MSTETETDLHERGFGAVKGAVQWLVTNRRTASGHWRYGDEYTGGNGGFTSTSEGVASLLFARAEEHARPDWAAGDLVTDDLTDEMLVEDLQWLADEAEGQHYPSTPYITDEPIDEFVDAAAFSLTSFILALNDPAGEHLRDDLEARIAETVDWFLDAQVDGSTGAGWGHAHPDSVTESVVPQKYFTYSVTIALTDFLTETSGVADNQREAARAAIEDAKDFLIHDATVLQGYLNFEPTDELSPIGKQAGGQPQLLPTCYVVWALGYVGTRLDDFDLTDAEHDKIASSLNYLRLVRDEADLLEYDEEYYVGRGTADGDGYDDKTAPYAFFGAFAEYPSWASTETGQGMETEYRELRQDLAEIIISDCWAGTPENPELGFRHFVDASNIDSDRNVAAVYATEIAIESLLAFGLEKPATADDPATAADFEETLTEWFETTAREDIVALAVESNVSGSAAAETLAAAEQQNQNYGTFYVEALDRIQPQFEEDWNKIMSKLAPEKSRKVTKGGANFVGIHTNRFFSEVVDKCYFETDPDLFERYVETYRRKHPLIIKSYQDVLDELAALDIEALGPVQKKEHIEEIVKRLEDDIFLEYTIGEITTDLRERDI